MKKENREKKDASGRLKSVVNLAEQYLPRGGTDIAPKCSKLYIRTFGCQLNERDTEVIAGLFLEKGYKLTDSPGDADIILFNTCSVRGHAEERAINSMAQLMHRCKNRVYGMVGCTAQALKDKLFERLPRLDIVCGTGEIARLPELVKEATNNKVNPRYCLALGNVDAPLPELKSFYRQSDKSAYVSIMKGCNNFCSYCIVPYVRGREHSRKVSDIVNEIQSLIKRGIKDITLLGQNVNSYKTCNFAQLLKIINDIIGVEKISFLTSHPKDANVELFKAMKDSDKVSKHLHLPLQSGSDRILKLMNRGYTRERYLSLATKARNIIPNLRLTTDVIVGFPTETEEDFNDTLNLMKEVKFGLAYIFKYSPRNGTEAAKLKDDVPGDVKRKRHKVLLDLQRGLSLRAPRSGAKQSQTKRLLRRPSLRSGLLAMTFAITLLLINPLAQAREISKVDFIEDINILFLKEDHTALIKNAEKNFKLYRLTRKEKKEVLYLMGLSYIKLNIFTRAREVFHKILAMKGDGLRQDAYIGIADSYFYEKSFSKAVSVYEEVLRRYPRSDRLSSVYYNLGLIFKVKKDFDRANYYFRKVKKRYSESFEADKSAYLPTGKTPDYYIVQLGAFKSLRNAKKLVRRLRRKKYDSYIQKAKKDGNILYKVRGGKFSNKYYAMRLLKKLRKSGFSAKVIVE